MSEQKFPIGARVIVKKNLKLKGKVLDFTPSWKGINFHPHKYDVVIDGECFAREFQEDSLCLESNLTVTPPSNLIDKQQILLILHKHFQRPFGWQAVLNAVNEIKAL